MKQKNFFPILFLSIFFLSILVVGALISGLFIKKTWGQDERAIREIVSQNKELSPKDREYQQNYGIYNVTSPAYKVDLNNDGSQEIIEIKKKDGMNELTLYDRFYQPLFQTSLLGLSDKNDIYKIRVTTLSSLKNLMVIFFQEGTTAMSHRAMSTTRIYFITYNNKELNEFKIQKGPLISYEKKSFPNRYRQRNYQVLIKDLDKDGVKEILIYSGGVSRALTYRHDQFTTFDE